MQRNVFLFILITVFTFFLMPVCLDATESRNTVNSTDLATLNRLIESRDGPDLITVMAAWCGPCIEELPILNRLYVKYRKEGLKLVGIAIDLEGPTAMQPIVDRLKVQFPIYWVGEKAVTAYNIDRLPMLLVVEDGRIIEKIPGKRSKKFLEEKILELCEPQKQSGCRGTRIIF
ncbi:TlpA family protein disulfide reductase [Thermodesulfobacteriota bacterium]